MAEAGSSSEDLCDENNWVFYKDRAEWRDVTPVPQDDGPYPIVAIAYSEKCEYLKRRANVTSLADPSRATNREDNWNI
jgi:hypothetical protein